MEDSKLIEWLNGKIDETRTDLSNLKLTDMTAAEMTYHIGQHVGKANAFKDCIEHIKTNKDK